MIRSVAATRPQTVLHTLRSAPLALAISVVFTAAALASAPSVAMASQAGTHVKEPAHPAALQPSATDRVRYIVQLRGEPLASYEGGVAGFAKSARVVSGKHAGRLDVRSAAAVAYVDYLANRQTHLVQGIEGRLGRPVDVADRMQHALNAIVVELTDAEAQQIADLPEVLAMERDRLVELHTDRGPAFIGAPSIWDGSASGGMGSRGEGMVVGIIDSGINPLSPAFAAVGPLDGYVHTKPAGMTDYLGLCGPVAPNADLGRCNDKLIGMFNYTSTVATRSAVDAQGHGSHTASTVAGNRWTAPYGGGSFTISGVAPHANVIAYYVCTSATSCITSASASSVNHAVSLGYVDALNYSIGGGTSPWSDSVSIAFRNAVNAGIFVAASAGNDGPGAGTTSHIEPWVQTVAASTKDNIAAFRFDLVGPGTPPVNSQGLPLRAGAPPLPTASIVAAPILQSPNFADGSNDGCSAYPVDYFKVLPLLPGAAADTIHGDGFDIERAKVGAVAVLSLNQNASNCGSGVRRTAALTAGAIGTIFVDPFFINLGASGTSWSMLRSDWDKAWLHIQANPQAGTASMLLPATSFPQRGNVIADFSSRGPRASSGTQFLIKPNITAPGVDVLAAYEGVVGGANSTSVQNGTSMSGPHIAGAATLLRAVRPSWTPTQMRSAMNMTARTDNIITATAAVPATAWDFGSGHVDLTAAARSGLLLNETNANFAATPSGSSLSTLNLAEFAMGACDTTCTFTRTVSNALAVSQTYNLSVTGLTAGAAVATPASFTITPGGTQVITLTVTGTLLAPTVWNFGDLKLDAVDTTLPRLRMPIAIRR